jgi:preprotein translocase subunit SecD
MIRMFSIVHYTIIENRINALGVAEPSIQKQGKDRLIIELPGLKDEGAAKGVIGRTAQLEFNLLREPAQLERAITVIDNAVAGKVDKSADSERKTARCKEKEGQELGEKLSKVLILIPKRWRPTLRQRKEALLKQQEVSRITLFS